MNPKAVGRLLLWISVPVFIFIFRLREALFGGGSLFRGYDGAIQSYPWLVKALTGWRHFDPPLWDFSTFSGASFVGELQTGVFYPLTALWAWIAPTQGKSLEFLVLVHYILAFCFMALLGRKMRFSLPATLLASLAFSTYLDWSQPNRMFGMIFLPLLFFFFLRSLEHASGPFNPWIFAAGAALACSLLAGHHQPFIHSAFCLALFAFVVVVRKGTFWRTCLSLTATGLVALLFSAPQTLLTWEYLGDAYRWIPNRVAALSPVPFDKYIHENTLNPQLLYYFTHSWMPVAGLVAVAVLWLDPCRYRKRLAGFALLLGAFSLLASMGHATPVGGLTWYVPGLNLVRETERFIFPFLFAVSLLMGIAVDALAPVLRRPLSAGRVSGSAPMRLLPQGIVFLAAGIWLWAHSGLYLYIQPGNDPLSPSLLYPVQPAAGASAAESAIRFLIDGFRQERGQCRVFNAEDALPPNMGDVYSIHSVSGHRATMYAPYFDYLERHWGDPDSARLDQLGACYWVTRKALDLPLLFHEGDLFVYRRPRAMHVFRMVDPATGRSRAAPLEEVHWWQNRVAVTLAEPGAPGTLVFAQFSYPGWHVAVDGSTRPLSKWDEFLAVDLRPGDRRVTFFYRPRLLYWGLLLAALAGMGLVATISFFGRGDSRF